MPSLKMSAVSMPPSVTNSASPSCGRELRYKDVMQDLLSEAGTARRRCRPGKHQNVALRVAATNAMRDRGKRAQQAFGVPEIAAAEGGERPARGVAHEPGHVVVGAPSVREAALLGGEQTLRPVPAARARERHHGVHVVEGTERVLRVLRPARGERREAIADVDPGEAEPPQQRGGVDQLRQGVEAQAPVMRRRSASSGRSS